MSTFNGFINEIPHISVDRFEPPNLKSKIFFLSHCHADHMVGLYEASTNFPGTLYASRISVLFLSKQYPGLKDNLKELDIGSMYLYQSQNNIKSYDYY